MHYPHGFTRTHKALLAALLATSIPGLSLAAPAGQAPKADVSAPFTLAGGAGNQVSPAMSGNTLVYSNCRSADCNIAGVDLSTRQGFPISEGASDEEQPSTDGIRVVWRDGRNAASSETDNRLNNFDIYGAYLSDKKAFPISKAPQMQNRPSVWGNTVVWADFRDATAPNDQTSGDIYMYDLASGQETLISNAKSAQVKPVTNGKVVVWADYRNEPDPQGVNSDLYGYDLVTKQEFVISNAPDEQTDPAISGNIVVWADYRKGDDTSDIYGYDLTAKKEFPISTAQGSQIQPAISGNIVVWADSRNEPDQKNGANFDIYGYDLNTGQEFPIYVGAGTQSTPEVSGSTVAWEDASKGNSDQDIMGATISGIPLTAAAPAPPALPDTGSSLFPQTGKSVSGIFLDYWKTHGGLQQQGYPISELMQEKSDLDGKTYTVQYFERAVFEYHPENQPPYNVLLSQLGTLRYRQKYQGGAPAQQSEQGSILFPQTGKRVGGSFLQYWQQNGGVAQQGYPISEEFQEKSDLDGKTYTVQYFERAVFEMHPENQPPYNVLLSQLGVFQYKQKYPSK
ncbi:MAG: hypothetical protein IVW55_09305 [Chloroflexi bacterium]|nr:hypothetical protein [Chloroflexota bacterium]